MEFISANEFLKQDEKVQEVLIEWWKPKFGDLASCKGIASHNENYKQVEDYCIVKRYSKEDENSKYEDMYGISLYNIFQLDSTSVKDYWIDFKNKFDVIPLFTEGQLRKFIEDKTNCHIEIIVGISGYVFVLRSKETLKEEKRISVLKRDLLQAYWKVAIQIAKES